MLLPIADRGQKPYALLLLPWSFSLSNVFFQIFLAGDAALMSSPQLTTYSD
jgi:hypothetical protein